MAHFVILQNQLNKNELNIQLEDSLTLPIPPEMAAKRDTFSV